MEPSVHSPIFTHQVVKAMRSLYPEELADRAWDNVGLLQENINPASGTVPPRVLLTNDLTPRVAEEAIKKQASVIVSYHPFIFRGLKSITLSDPHQLVVLRLAQANIAVYSPHTAADAVLGGVNDWLAGILRRLPGLASAPPIISVVQPTRGAPPPAGFEGAGYGRLAVLPAPVELEAVLQVYSAALGMRHIQVAQPRGFGGKVGSVAVCAGSGYSVLKDVEADLVLTGEVSHHDALRLTMLGRCVATVFHSNSERGFLREVLRPQLEGVLREEVEGVEVVVSEEDKDPFEIWEAR
ncbi:GTP cyclohydrolase 1 type 2/Nif3 [Staphylotrichum tortipilum]|uniref:GTP cyclohydrolase 1 type 2/Nif3 n=1 Tax=Staphylotrichum tortipilum TaxID=2831512 RepID=A0AAN6MB11_9PEZI|nr:GTP cyclohydrolase 1 type 2/Nif3 [Staphylotrichum longicolle]